jgi:hypothetical protein
VKVFFDALPWTLILEVALDDPKDCHWLEAFEQTVGEPLTQGR